MSADMNSEAEGRILLTGFEPYNGAERNPSGEVAEALAGSKVRELRIVSRVFPVSTVHAPAAIRQAIDESAPDFVLMLGVWPGRPAFSIERVAINLKDFPFDDNDGARPVDELVVTSGTAAYFSTLPVRPVVDAWLGHGLPGAVSYSAGTYLCNQCFYVALHHTQTNGPRVGFIHLPTIPSEAARRTPPEPSLPHTTLIEGVRVALEALTLSGYKESSAGDR